MLPAGVPEALIPIPLRIVAMIGRCDVVDGAKNVIREGDEQTDRGKRSDQQQEYQQNFQAGLLLAREIFNLVAKSEPAGYNESGF